MSKPAESTAIDPLPVGESAGNVDDAVMASKYLCLTILGYRKPGMSEAAYRRHMNMVSAPMTKDLMVKYGVKRWTVIHNPLSTRQLMTQLYDRQMANVADYDCFSQVVFEDLEHYKAMKSDPWYKKHLFDDHENFADTKRSLMTIGWIEEWVNNSSVRDGLEFEDSRSTSLSEDSGLSDVSSSTTSRKRKVREEDADAGKGSTKHNAGSCVTCDHRDFGTVRSSKRCKADICEA